MRTEIKQLPYATISGATMAYSLPAAYWFVVVIRCFCSNNRDTAVVMKQMEDFMSPAKPFFHA
jgi:uncharacterized membrane protein